MKHETFGLRIRRLRMEHGYTQKELARLAGLSGHAAVGRMETGIRNPSPEALLQLSRVFGVPVEYLLHGGDTPQQETPVVSDGKFRVRGKPRERSSIQVFPHTGQTIRRMAEKNGISVPDLMEQMVDYCIKNMSE